jgi:hypothetical protein
MLAPVVGAACPHNRRRAALIIALVAYSMDWGKLKGLHLASATDYLSSSARDFSNFSRFPRRAKIP